VNYFLLYTFFLHSFPLRSLSLSFSSLFLFRFSHGQLFFPFLYSLGISHSSPSSSIPSSSSPHSTHHIDPDVTMKQLIAKRDCVIAARRDKITREWCRTESADLREAVRQTVMIADPEQRIQAMADASQHATLLVARCIQYQASYQPSDYGYYEPVFQQHGTYFAKKE